VNEEMNLKDRLLATKWLSGKKHISNWLIYVVAFSSLVAIGASFWLGTGEWRASRQAEAAEGEATAALQQLGEPIQSLKRVLSDPQVQALAARALEDPEKLKDLFAYANGRIPQISAVQVFPSDLEGVRPDDLGPNGYAVLDMALSALSGKRALLQVHNALKPSMLVDAAPIEPEDELLGALIVTLEPAYLLDAFQPKHSQLGAMRLSQYNGSQPASNVAEVGDGLLLGDFPDRISVPGTLFRLERPRQDPVILLGYPNLILMAVLGAFGLAAVVLMRRSNRQWKLERRVEEARKKALRPAEPVEAEFEEQVPVREPPVLELVSVTSDAEAAAEEALKMEPERDPAPIPPPMHLKYNLPEQRKLRESEHEPVELRREIFRAYDIRGVINRTLDSGVARQVGQAVGTQALEHDAGPVVVARDGRLSGPYLMAGMIEGILSAGCDVLDIGAVPTGVLYFAAHEIAAGSGVMITGSHNPPDYNGFKIMVGGDTLHGEGIAELYERIVSGRLKSGKGEVVSKNVVPDYIAKIAGDIQVERPLKVVVDCGNGIGGVCAADTLRAIGVEVLPLFDEVDGTFPNHHPDPSEPENLQDLIESVRLMDADLGLAFDGDADRLGVVTLAGNIIFPDRVMMLLAMDVLDRVPGATIIYDVKCTGHLPEVIRKAGGVPMMYKTGHSLIKARMKEVGSPFAGEMSGHFFFKERWYGVDDGIYSAARLLEILAGTETPPEAVLNALPSSYSTPELKVQMQEGENHQFIEDFRAAAKFGGARISSIDGLRADFDDGWGLVRASNTTPILVVRFDADTEAALARIKEDFRKQMLGIRADLELPF
jgi:phosphomannomutase/phosphoglucomutase